MRLPNAARKDPSTIAEYAREGHWFIARQCRTPEVIRAVLGHLEDRRDAATLFMRASVTGPEVSEQWVEAIDALRTMENPEIARSDKWGSAKRRANIRAIAANPRLVEGVRTAVVGATNRLDIDWFAVLAADASEASIDALLPHVARALDHDGELLDVLLAVVEKAPDPVVLQRLSDALKPVRTSRVTAAGVSALAAHLGVTSERVRFHAELFADGHAKICAWVKLGVDGRSALPVVGSLSVGQPLHGTTASEGDAPEVTALTGQELEASLELLRAAATSSSLVWRWCELHTNLRGQRSRRLAEWLGDALQTKVTVRHANSALLTLLASTPSE